MSFTLQTYLLCLAAGLLGIAFHIFAVKIPAVKTSAQVGNVPFSYGNFFQDELAAILASIIMVVIFLFILQEVLAMEPAIKPYLVISFVFVGFSGSSFLVSLLGKAQGKVNSIINSKTDIADSVVPPPATDHV